MQNEHHIYSLHELTPDIYSRIWLIAIEPVSTLNTRIDSNGTSLDAIDSNSRPTKDDKFTEKNNETGFFLDFSGRNEIDSGGANVRLFRWEDYRNLRFKKINASEWWK